MQCLINLRFQNGNFVFGTPGLCPSYPPHYGPIVPTGAPMSNFNPAGFHWSAAPASAATVPPFSPSATCMAAPPSTPLPTPFPLGSAYLQQPNAFTFPSPPASPAGVYCLDGSSYAYYPGAEMGEGDQQQQQDD